MSSTQSIAGVVSINGSTRRARLYRDGRLHFLPAGRRLAAKWPQASAETARTFIPSGTTIDEAHAAALEDESWQRATRWAAKHGNGAGFWTGTAWVFGADADTARAEQAEAAAALEAHAARRDTTGTGNPQVCATQGHAVRIVNNVEQDTCPRCGERLLWGIPAADELGDRDLLTNSQAELVALQDEDAERAEPDPATERLLAPDQRAALLVLGQLAELLSGRTERVNLAPHNPARDAALRDAVRPYLETWVMPHLVAILTHDRELRSQARQEECAAYDAAARAWVRDTFKIELP